MPKPVHIVFSSRTSKAFVGNREVKELTYGVYIDLEELELLAIKASKNKSRRAKDGPLVVELHTIREVREDS